MTDLAALKDALHELRCSNHGCIFAMQPIGMGTNGPCHCLDELRRTDFRRAQVVRRMAIFIKQLPVGVEGAER